MEIKAVQKYVRMSPRKLRLVASLVKDLPPQRAVEVLPHLGKRAAEPLRKTIISAITNAKTKKISDNDLVFKEIQINEGPRLKRMRAGARGMFKPYQKKMSHIRVVLEAKEVKVKKGHQRRTRSFQKAKPSRGDKASKKSSSTLPKPKKRTGGKKVRIKK